ncbi:MAG: VOC family protein [Bacteroidales bacterium]|jgi:catechol 2,3-dioxygenase-like lactoylglutathione lyase family enzyme|nr:VOC family protein [Bacteroidales bacterium]
MSELIISGIQQMGVGIPDVHQAWKWYREYFGVDIRIFEEAAVAALMLPYTGGEPRERHAALAINLQGGGGFEIWQYRGRIPQPPAFQILPGDLGIYSCKIKCKDIKATHDFYLQKNAKVTPIYKDPSGSDFFYITDPYNNIFQVVKGNEWFSSGAFPTGGVYGAVIGVSDVEVSKKFYADILGYDTVVYDQTGNFEDMDQLSAMPNQYRRVLLNHSKPRKGAFSKLLGPSQIELIQVIDRTPRKIFEGRFWGDLGFIHLCFDINGMDIMRAKCKLAGYPFTVDTSANSDTFDMGEAAGSFAYIEDPDGGLIEFVETHKLPILKKIGWYLNLRKRNPEKALPGWMLKALRFNRVKN